MEAAEGEKSMWLCPIWEHCMFSAYHFSKLLNALSETLLKFPMEFHIWVAVILIKNVCKTNWRKNYKWMEG